MRLWNYCAICGERIEVGEPCIGVEKNSELIGDSICLDCAKIENFPGGKEPVSITDLLARAEAAEEKLRLEKEARACSIQRANMWRAQRDNAEARAEAAEAENKRWSQVCEAQERRIAELETRAKKAEAKLEAAARAEKAERERDGAILELEGVIEAVKNLDELIGIQIHPIVDYNLYCLLRDSADTIMEWKYESKWRGQKEE